MKRQTAVEWMFMMLANHNILNHKALCDNKHLTDLTYRIKRDANQMGMDQALQAFKAGQDSMEEGGKSFDQWYEITYGKTN